MLPRSLSFFMAAIMLAATLSAGAVQASDNIDWDNKRDAARAHSSAIKLAWGMMSSWIQRRPRGADLDLTRVRGPHVWPSGTTSAGLPSVITAGVPGVPPVWNPLWTERGLSFAFCDQVLAIYAKEELRGADMPTVAVEGGLQIIRGGEAKGTPQSGYATVPIPGCMTLPDGHVALVATSTDPFGWTATRRRNEHSDWELGCPMPGGDPAATIGKVRYAQTRPIELHPWSGADMDRWPDLCRDRPAAGGTFGYTGPVYGTVTGTLPAHGECSPPGSGSVGDHIAGAIRNNGCRKPTKIGGTRQPRWHFYDTLCADAALGGDPRTVNFPGNRASTHTVPVSEGDGSVFLGPPSSGPGRHADYQYKGTPLPAPFRPPIPACNKTENHCPAGFKESGQHGAPGSGDAGERTAIEKVRYLWKQSAPGQVAAGNWGENRRRDYTEPPGSTPLPPDGRTGRREERHVDPRKFHRLLSRGGKLDLRVTLFLPARMVRWRAFGCPRNPACPSSA